MRKLKQHHSVKAKKNQRKPLKHSGKQNKLRQAKEDNGTLKENHATKTKKNLGKPSEKTGKIRCA